MRCLLVLPLVLVAACADDAPDRAMARPGAEVRTVIVTIERSRFSDAELAVPPGTTVVFVNRDAVAHTVTARDEAPVAFDSGAMAQDAQFEVTFDRPGTYPYFCAIHPTMRARVIVG